MLTRLAVSGFKNLVDVDVSFGPFTCIAGPNGVGKSNVFDVISLLAALASGDSMMEAAQRVRGSDEKRLADVRDIFWGAGMGSRDLKMTVTAEMIVPQLVEDELGSQAKARATFLRYTLGIGYVDATKPGSLGRLKLLSEDLRHITKGDAHKSLRFPHRKGAFRDAVVIANRWSKTGAFLSTVRDERGTLINVHSDGTGGRPRPLAAENTSRTVLSTITTNENPTVLAARREMQNWVRLALEPSALRAADDVTAPSRLATNGAHLAATLYRIANTPREDGSAPEPEKVYARIAGRLSLLTGVRIAKVWVDLDPKRDVFALFVEEREGVRLPAKSLSEGTLRFLALCVLLEDSRAGGLILMEEPENGIHPANLESMVELVRQLAVDPMETPGEDNPFRQVIINTHSPGVVQLCEPADLLLAEAVGAPGPDGRTVPALQLLPYGRSWRADPGSGGFTMLDWSRYVGLQPNRHPEFNTLF